MIEQLENTIEKICRGCGALCCIEACPPLTEERIRIITELMGRNGFYEYCGYHRLKTEDTGKCVLLKDGLCSVNSHKPETCRAGPFTFATRGTRVEIFLKKECICPLVAYLKSDPDAYAAQLALAVRNIAHLLSGLPPAEVEAINRIEEPETEKVGEFLLPVGAGE